MKLNRVKIFWHALFCATGIEIMFPRESYYAWYGQPTTFALQAAHSRVAERLALPGGCIATQNRKDAFAITTSLQRGYLDILTPPETPILARPAPPMAISNFCHSLVFQPQSSASSGTISTYADGCFQRRIAQEMAGLDTPDSYASIAVPRTPLDSGPVSYDGLICFSQGCAVSTGLLLELNACGRPLPVRFVVLICGGRPFDWNGTMERLDLTKVAPIGLPSIHVLGKKDPGLEESRRLASLFSDAGKQVIELDVGHCPPRRTTDVGVVAAAIRKMISELI